MIALLEQRGIQDRCVLAAMMFVSREPFVTPGDEASAYADRPLAIGHGQTISQPYIVARMLEALELQGGEHLLEIGTGSGYSAAVASELAAHVYTIERDPVLSSSARARLAALAYDGISITCGDGSLGWPEHAPYDAIMVTAGGPSIPQPLTDQLAVGGRLVMPVGNRDMQQLLLVTKIREDQLMTQDLGSCLFVPLVGAFGWPEERAT